jgi:hypothetical protein
MGARVAKLRATTMAGVIAKLLAAAPHVTEDELKDDAHSAVLAGAALDARVLANVQIGEARKWTPGLIAAAPSPTSSPGSFSGS